MIKLIEYFKQHKFNTQMLRLCHEAIMRKQQIKRNIKDILDCAGRAQRKKGRLCLPAIAHMRRFVHGYGSLFCCLFFRDLMLLFTYMSFGVLQRLDILAIHEIQKPAI